MDINYTKYHGRGIILAESKNGESIVAYFIMGRSENSRNRVFEIKNSELFTTPADTSKVTDPSLIIYRALTTIKKDNSTYLIVTNGSHTNTVVGFIKSGKTFEEALQICREEPDAPNYTPRISGIIEFKNGVFDYKLSILKRNETNEDKCERLFFNLDKKKEYGHFIHTYKTDGNPLPSFEGEPKLIKIPSNIDTFTNELWQELDEENKISLYVRFTDPKTLKYNERLINKYTKIK